MLIASRKAVELTQPTVKYLLEGSYLNKTLGDSFKRCSKGLTTPSRGFLPQLKTHGGRLKEYS
jgi:hypothetical protein